MKVLVILFCNWAYFQYPDGHTQIAPGWNDQMCRDIRRTDAKAGNEAYCWQDHKMYYSHRERCIRRN